MKFRIGTDRLFRNVAALCVSAGLVGFLISRMSFETLQRDFNTVCFDMGLVPRKLSFWNRTKDKGHFSIYYNSTTVEIVATKYAVELEEFNYGLE